MTSFELLTKLTNNKLHTAKIINFRKEQKEGPYFRPPCKKVNRGTESAFSAATLSLIKITINYFC